MTPPAKCFLCETSDADLPLLRLEYRGQPRFVCPEHVPVLIHQTEMILPRLRDEAAERVAG